MSLSENASLLTPVDLTDLRAGNTGIDHVHRFDSGRAGPEVLVTALVHGNELCGAHAIRRFFDQDIRPEAGTLTICLCNVAAYDSFDPLAPARSRYVDEDFNRVWDRESLQGPRRSVELDRAREIAPLVAGADLLLDLHSMQSHCEPLMLSGIQPRAQKLARQMGYPRIIVADEGHAAGRRMRDFDGFGRADSDATALLAECGQHLDPVAADNAREILARFLMVTETISLDAASRLSPLHDRPEPRLIEVTERVTVRSPGFHFTGSPESLDRVPKAGDIIAMDGDEAVRAPYDDCILIMPSRRLNPGQTAVRLGRYVG